MIKLYSGSIIFRDLSLEVEPWMTSQEFRNRFPADRIVRENALGNGYLWLDVRERLYEGEECIPISFCFNADGELEYVDLFPQHAGTPPEDWEARKSWSAEEQKKDLKACSAWLLIHCGITQSAKFLWGNIGTFTEPKSGVCGINLHYRRQGKSRRR